MTATRALRLVHAHGVTLKETRKNLGLRTQPVDATHKNSSSSQTMLKTRRDVDQMAVQTKAMATAMELAIIAIHGTTKRSLSQKMQHIDANIRLKRPLMNTTRQT